MKGRKLTAILVSIVLVLAMLPAEVMADGNEGVITLFPQYPGGINNPEIISDCKECTLPKYPDTNGWGHIGWTETQGNDPEYRVGEIFPIEGNLTLYAVWGNPIRQLNEHLKPAQNEGEATASIALDLSQIIQHRLVRGDGQTIPSKVTIEGNEYPVTVIKEEAFYDCNGITGSLKLPDTITTIGRSAFRYCSGFTGSLTIPDGITAIEDYTFGDCSGFTGSLIIPDKVTYIGVAAFAGCKGFTGDLTIPDGVTTIDKGAFSNCSGFAGTLSIPESITEVGHNAFKKTQFETIVNNSDVVIDCIYIIDQEDENSYFYCDENGQRVNRVKKGTYFRVNNNCKSISDASVTVNPASYTYTGKECKPDVTVTLDGKVLKTGTDYSLWYRNNTNAGTGTVTVVGKGDYTSAVSKTFTIGKAEQKVNIPSTSFTATYGDAPFSLKATSSGGGKLTYTSGNSNVATVDSKGTVTIKGTGSTTIKIDAAETANYKSASKTVNITVKAKPAPVKVYKVATQTDGNGTASASPASGASGTKVTVTARPKAGYQFKKWTVLSGGVTLSDPNKASATFTIKSSDVKVKATFAKKQKESIKKANVVLARNSLVYNGRNQKVTVKSVKLNNKTLVSGTDYTVSCSPATVNKVGKYKVKIKGTGDYYGEKTVTLEVKKANNPLIAVPGKSTCKVAYAKLAKAKQTINRSEYLAVSKAQGKVSYKKTAGNGKITIERKTGNITVKKGLQKGNYRVSVKVTVAGNKNYNGASKTQTFNIKVE